MRRPRYRPLVASLLAAAVVACDGPGLGGGSSGLPPGPFYISGKANVNGRTLETGDAAAVTGEKSLAIQGEAPDSEILVFDLK